MYQNIFHSKLTSEIFVWDDQKGLLKFSSLDFHYAYAKKKGGNFKSLFGDELEKITAFDKDDPDLFESDLNIEMKVLLDLYPMDEEISKGHRVIIYDIETSIEGGFPNISTGDKPITAIALYDVTANKYYSLILDVERKVKDKVTGNEITKSFETEQSLLIYFLNLWDQINHK